MKENVIEKARRDSINSKRKKVVRRRRKIINYVTLLLLIASIITNIALIKNINFNSVKNFNEISYGEDYDKEFESVNTLIESCIKDCIKNQINSDTHRAVDENGIDTGNYYYNFTSYDNVFSNLEITVNKYQMQYNDTQIFTNSIDNLSEEERASILVHYGTNLINGDNAKENFKNHVGNILKENNISDEMIEALAKGAVKNLSGNLLDSHWIDNNLGKGL